MALNFFEIQELFMIDTFSLITVNQFEKSGSIRKVFLQLRNLKINSTIENRNRSRFSRLLHFSCSIEDFVFLITKEMNGT